MHRPSVPGEVLTRMRPPGVFANRSTCDLEKLRDDLRGRWWVAVRAVVLPSLRGPAAAEIAALTEAVA